MCTSTATTVTGKKAEPDLDTDQASVSQTRLSLVPFHLFFVMWLKHLNSFTETRQCVRTASRNRVPHRVCTLQNTSAGPGHRRLTDHQHLWSITNLKWIWLILSLWAKLYIKVPKDKWHLYLPTCYKFVWHIGHTGLGTESKEEDKKEEGRKAWRDSQIIYRTVFKLYTANYIFQCIWYKIFLE